MSCAFIINDISTEKKNDRESMIRGLFAHHSPTSGQLAAVPQKVDFDFGNNHTKAEKVKVCSEQKA